MSDKLFTTLDSLGVKWFEFIQLAHRDYDQIGSVPDVLNYRNVSYILAGDAEKRGGEEAILAVG